MKVAVGRLEGCRRVMVGLRFQLEMEGKGRGRRKKEDRIREIIVGTASYRGQPASLRHFARKLSAVTHET